MKKTLPEAAAEFQAKQDKRTLEVVKRCATRASAAAELGISRQALRMRLLRIEVNQGKA